MTFGERLRDLRGDKTLRETADAFGMSLSYLSDLERGRTIPSMKLIVHMANLYQMSVVNLIEPVVWKGEHYHPVLPFEDARRHS